MRPTEVSATIAASVIALLLGSLGDARAGGRRIFWSETELQLDDLPKPQTKRIWARESGDEPPSGYYTLLNPLNEAPILTGLARPAGVFVEVLSGKIYWADSEFQLIGRSGLDGRSPEELFTTGTTVEGIAVDGGSDTIYFTELNMGRVRRANLDGTEMTTLIEFGFGGQGIALDVPGGKVYYAIAGVGEIHRMNLDGSGDESLVDTDLDNPRGLAIDTLNGKLYWVDDDEVEDLERGPRGVVVDPTSHIHRANLDGSGAELLVDTGATRPWGIAVDPFRAEMYWAAADGVPSICAEGGCTGSIRRARTDGSGPEILFSGQPAPKGIALELPLPGCNASQSAKLNLKPQVSWKWGQGEAVSKEDFGDPTTDTDYWVCFFDEESDTPDPDPERDQDSSCSLAEAGDTWKDKGTGFKRRTGEQKGVVKVKLKAGDAGKAKIKVKGKVLTQPTKPFDQDPDFIMQLVNSDLSCWESRFPTPSKLNDGAKFKDKIPE